MSLCTLCGHPTLAGDELCAYHCSSHGEDWATGNRIMCEFLHRGIVLAAPPARARRALDSPELETLLRVQQARTVRWSAADAGNVRNRYRVPSGADDRQSTGRVARERALHVRR